MIVLEGADCTGKTTLAEKLHEELGWEVWHSGAATSGYLDFWLKPLINHPNQDLILDRWHLGDLVYGPIWRGQTMNFQTLMAIELALQVRGATLIHTYAEPWLTAARLKERGDLLVGPDEIVGHMEAYRSVIPRSILPTVTWSFDRLGQLPMTEIRDRHQRADWYREAFPSMPGVGNLHPYYIFVGERPNPRKVDESFDVPFAVGTAGEWLFDALEELDLLGDLYLTNAIKSDGDRDMVAQEVQWVRRLNKNSKVVALGGEASKILERHKIHHEVVQHPAYARRFHYAKNYAKHLDEVIK